MHQSLLAWLVLTIPSVFSVPVKTDLGKGIINFYTRPRTSSSLARRQNHASSLANERDVDYVVNATLGGVSVAFFLDTGSSDLYSTVPIPAGESTGEHSHIAFGDGTAIDGPIKTAQFEFAGFTIPQQAFIQSNPSQDTNQGLIGLGPDRNSDISNQFTSQDGTQDVQGNSALANILNSNPNMPPILTLTLGRANESSQGTVTVGQVLPGFEAINDQPKLDVFTEEAGVREWKTFLDKDGFKVNGKTVPLPQSNISSSGQFAILLDAGNTSPSVPPFVAEAIYGSIPGALFLDDVQRWQVPCDAVVNVSWTFGGVDIPMHPLDMTRVMPSDETKQTCQGSWRPKEPEPNNNDASFGMGFLRNTYMLINMGNAVGKANPGFNKDAKPFIQLLGITDPAKAHEEFLTARVSGYVSPQTSPTSTSTSGKSTPAPGTGSSAAKNGAGSIIRHTKLGATVLTTFVGGLIALV